MGEHGGDDGQAEQVFADDALCAGDGRQNEAELPHLRQADAGERGGGEEVPERLRQGRRDRHLDDKDEAYDEQHVQDMAGQEDGVGEHPEGHEEEGSERISEGRDLSKRPVPRSRTR